MFWKVKWCIDKEKQDVLLHNSDSLEIFFCYFLIDWREKVGGGKKMVSGSGSVCLVRNGNDCSSSADSHASAIKAARGLVVAI